MFVIGSEYPEIMPSAVILGDVKSRRFIRMFKKDHAEILFGKLKNIFPYGKRFSTEDAEIVSFEEAVYKFGGKLYSFVKDSFKEVILGKTVKKKEVATPRKCKYKMYLATFYDVVTEDFITKYVVEPV